jgi:hypothetical protein
MDGCLKTIGAAMDASTLGLPLGVDKAEYIDGMREVVAYDCINDRYMARWDTVIAGQRHEHFPPVIFGKVFEMWLAQERREARAKFESIEAAHANLHAI